VKPPTSQDPQAILTQAAQAYRAGRDAEAIRMAQAVLALAPEAVEALRLLGRTAARAGDAQAALRAYAAAARLRPADPDFPYRQAMILARMERLEEALAGFEAALEREAGHAGALLNRAVALHRLSRLPEALLAANRLLATHAHRPEGWALQAKLLEALGRLPEAVAAQARATALQPGEPEPQARLGALLTSAGEYEAGLAHCELALAAAPGHPGALLARGRALQTMRHHPEALAALSAAVQAGADPLPARHALANALTALGRWGEAAECREILLREVDRQLATAPGDPVLLRKRGALLFDLDRWKEALAAYEDIPDGKDDSQILGQRGLLLFMLAREEEGLALYRHALARAPDSARLRLDAAMHRLAMGDMPAAWREHEARWQVADFPSPRRHFSQPLWLGQEPIADRRILLHAEQGLGDTLQFCRYASMVAARGAEVILEVEPPLLPLMRSLAGPRQLVAKGEPLPPFDLHCPLLSLPLAFGTSLATIPATLPYLAADPERLQHWQARLGPAQMRRIGLVWAGNAGHGNDRRRSMPLAAAAPLFGRGAEVISLQHQLPERDRASLAALPGLRLLGQECRDFADTAALLSLLDVVVTVDTAVAHLAGALGRPVCILLAQPSDWRWMLRRDDSPWYPTARLFRQERRGDWAGVMARLVAHLDGAG
jgi:tetratricopeptide (TPR) repeat protein